MNTINQATATKLLSLRNRKGEFRCKKEIGTRGELRIVRTIKASRKFNQNPVVL